MVYLIRGLMVVGVGYEDQKHHIKTIFLTVLVPDFQTQHHKRIFFKKVQSERGIPFDLKLDYEPNDKTKKALMNGEYEEVKNIDDLWK